MGCFAQAAFQSSAGTLTQFYKDTIEAMNTVQDKAVQYGYHKRRRETALRADARRRGQPAQGDNACELSPLVFQLAKTMLSDGEVGAGAVSPLRPLKRRPPPADDILEAIFIKRARPS